MTRGLLEETRIVTIDTLHLFPESYEHLQNVTRRYPKMCLGSIGCRQIAIVAYFVACLTVGKLGRSELFEPREVDALPKLIQFISLRLHCFLGKVVQDVLGTVVG